MPPPCLTILFRTDKFRAVLAYYWLVVVQNGQKEMAYAISLSPISLSILDNYYYNRAYAASHLPKVDNMSWYRPPPLQPALLAGTGCAPKNYHGFSYNRKTVMIL